MGGVEKLNELAKIMESARKECVEKGKAAFTDAVAELFQAHPKLDSYSWTQYTPYFNDGDACEFRIGAVDSVVVDGKEYDDEPVYMLGSTWEVCAKEVAQWPAEAKAAIAAVGNVHEAICAMEESAELAFGNHVQVTVRRTGIEVEEYDHD